MMKYLMMLILAMTCVLPLSACGSDSEKIQGIWVKRDVNNPRIADYIEIGKDYAVINGIRQDNVLFEETDDAIIMSKVGEEHESRLILHGDDLLTLEISKDMKVDLVRSTKKDYDAAILKKSKESSEPTEIKYKKHSLSLK